MCTPTFALHLVGVPKYSSDPSKEWDVDPKTLDLSSLLFPWILRTTNLEVELAHHLLLLQHPSLSMLLFLLLTRIMMMRMKTISLYCLLD